MAILRRAVRQLQNATFGFVLPKVAHFCGSCPRASRALSAGRALWATSDAWAPPAGVPQSARRIRANSRYAERVHRFICAALLVLGCASDPTKEQACAPCDEDVERTICGEAFDFCEADEGCSLAEFASDDVAVLCGR